MSIKVDPQIARLAQNASNATGLDPNVILAQWQAERGVQSVSQWDHNNPAGIKQGNPIVDSLSNGNHPAQDGGFFDQFMYPAIGAQAYVTLIQKDPNYQSIRDAAVTGDPLKEIAAIGHSPWGTDYNSLLSVYGDLTNTNPTGNGTNGIGQTSAAQNQNNPGLSLSPLMKWLGFTSGNARDTLLIIGGSILIILIIYRMAIK